MPLQALAALWGLHRNTMAGRLRNAGYRYAPRGKVEDPGPKIVRAIEIYHLSGDDWSWGDVAAEVGWASHLCSCGRMLSRAVSQFRARWDDDAAALADSMRRRGKSLDYVASIWGVSPWTMGARLRHRGYEYVKRPNAKGRRMSDERLAIVLAGGEMHDAGGVSWDACAAAVGWDVEKAHRGRTLRAAVLRVRGSGQQSGRQEVT